MKTELAPWQGYLFLAVIAVILLPVAAVAVAAVKLLELVPFERQRLAALGATAAGALLLVCLHFSLAGPGFTATQFCRFAARSWEQAKQEMLREPVKPEPEPFDWRYAGLVAGSSLGWGLTAAGVFSLWRRQEEKSSKVTFGRSTPTEGEKKALQRVAKMQHPPDGFLLGVEVETLKPVIVNDKKMNMHMLILGGPGSGKTTTLKNPLEFGIERGFATIFLDGKGDFEFAQWVRKKAEAAGRTCWVFSFTKDSCHYDPLASGGATELKDKLLHLEDWGTDAKYWETTGGRYLQLMLQILQKLNAQHDLPAVFRHFHPDRLKMLVRKMDADSETKDEYFDVLSKYEKDEKIEGLAARLATLAESEIAHLFRREGDVIDLTQAILNREVVVFSLDSLRFPDFARLLGKLVVVDLKGALARAWRIRQQPVYAVLDEFNVFASDKIVDAVGKGRGFGLRAIIATQSLSDIEAALGEAGKAVVNQILDNCKLFIAHQANAPETAQILADLPGTVPAIEITRQVQHFAGFSIPTGKGTVKQVDRYPFHPNTIKWLRAGQYCGVAEVIFIDKLELSAQKVLVRMPAE
ncbi:MAG: TraM recognition domain-containing protein [Bacillota bacterium]